LNPDRPIRAQTLSLIAGFAAFLAVLWVAVLAYSPVHGHTANCEICAAGHLPCLEAASSTFSLEISAPLWLVPSLIAGNFRQLPTVATTSRAPPV
jgi:hypothetical protein